MGSDRIPYIVYHVLALFQSTLPHGERLDALFEDTTLLGFNPRSRMGSDSPLAG